MECVRCGSVAATKRPERTARGYRRFRLAVLTRSGRELDRRVFSLEDSGTTAADVARAVQGSVPVVDGTG